MSLRIFFESAFTCPHADCKHKSKKFDSVASVNMHISKKHDKNLKLVEVRERDGTLRLVLRMK